MGILSKFLVLAKAENLAQSVSSLPQNQWRKLHGQTVKTKVVGPHPL